MDGSSRLLASSVLSIECPHCAAVDTDDYEVFGLREMQAMRCAQCSATFSFIALDCTMCGEEFLFSWPAPDAASADGLRCPECGRCYFDDEAIAEPEGVEMNFDG